MTEPRLIQAAGTISKTLDLGEDEQVAALQQEGFDEGEAHRLVALLPIAFSRPVLEELGVEHFDPEITAYEPDGTLVRAVLLRQPEYAGRLLLARRHRKHGVMDHEIYKRVCGSSADIDAVSRALNEGADIVGSAVSSALLSTEVVRHLVK
jgi:hypothetical protein